MATTESPENSINPEEFYEQFKDDPELERLPLPKAWYKKFGIPAPRPVSFQDFALGRSWLEHKFDSNIVYEIRDKPEPGGVRPILEPEPVPVEIITKPTNESAPENQQQSLQNSEDSTKSNETTPQES
jgi:hypothetical protein